MTTETITGLALKEMRLMCGLSQYQLSIIAAIPRNRISLAECGYLVLRAEEQSSIHQALLKITERKAAQLNGLLSNREPLAV